MKSFPSIRTADAAIDALGGTASVARLLGVLPSAVSNWRKYGCFPPRLLLELRSIAVSRGVVLPDKLFRQTTRTDRDDPRRESALAP